MIDTKLQIEAAHKTPSRINTKIYNTRYIVFKLQKLDEGFKKKYKEKLPTEEEGKDL